MSLAVKLARGRVTTAAIEAMSFIAPVKVGDFICCYAEVIKTGNTSVQVKVETWAIGPFDEKRRQVTQGIFIYVAINEEGRPRPIRML